MKRNKYEFVLEGHNFNDDEAVVHLGVGKNMVASIKFLMKALGLNRDGVLSSIAHKLLNTDRGYDPFLRMLVVYG